MLTPKQDEQGRPTLTRPGVKSVIRKHPLVAFFVLAQTDGVAIPCPRARNRPAADTGWTQHVQVVAGRSSGRPLPNRGVPNLRPEPEAFNPAAGDGHWSSDI